MAMSTSPAGVSAIRVREGCRLTAYQDAIGVWTIGVGHVGRASGAAVHPGQSCTMAEAELWLASDLKPMELAVNEACGGHLTQNQFDACVSLAFNIGSGAFRNSSVARHCRAGEWAQAADAFLMWDQAGGHEVPGLLNRRRAERVQFLTPDAPPLVATVTETVSVTYAAPAPPIPSPGPVALPAPQPNGLARLWGWLRRANGKGA